MTNCPEKVQIDFTILADRAEVLNGKLYMMGGAYDRRFIDELEEKVPITIVVGVLVPWNLTNQPHPISIRLESEDGEVVGRDITGTVTVGRPPNANNGQVFRAMAVITMNVELPKVGAYKVTAETSEGERKSTTFYTQMRQTTVTSG